MQEKEICNLTQEELELIQFFRSIPYEKKDKFMVLLESIKKLIQE